VFIQLLDEECYAQFASLSTSSVVADAVRCALIAARTFKGDSSGAKWPAPAMIRVLRF
jgi:hypothetical protein